MSIIFSALFLWAWFWWLCAMACFVMARIPLYVCSLLVLLGVNVMRLLGFQDKHIKDSKQYLIGSSSTQEYNPQWKQQPLMLLADRSSTQEYNPQWKQQPLMLLADQQHDQSQLTPTTLSISRASSLCSFVNPLALLPDDCSAEPDDSRQSSYSIRTLQETLSDSSDTVDSSISATASVSLVAAATALAALAATKKGTPANPAAFDTSVAATAIGAAMLATRLMRSSSSNSNSSCSTPMSMCSSVSSTWCIPPLEVDVSAKELQELESKAPDDLLCPLGRVLMTDPVFTPSGFTYQRQCLLEVLSLTGRDPAGSFLLGPDQLCSNINMRDQVARWLQDNGVLA